jgi:hypothetical protein
MFYLSGSDELLADGIPAAHPHRRVDPRRRAVPTVDLFSFARPGDPWFAWSGWADVTFALAQLAGLGGALCAAA